MSRSAKALLGACIAATVACKRQAPPGPGPIESGPSPPPAPPVTYKLTVTELPPIDLGPPDAADPVDFLGSTEQPTHDGGVVVLEKRTARYPAGRFDLRKFGPDGRERWHLSLVGDDATSRLGDAAIAVDGTVVWLMVDTAGTLVIGGTQIIATRSRRDTQLVVVRLDLDTGRLEGHSLLRVRAPLRRHVRALGGGIVMLARADLLDPTSQRLMPDHAEVLVRLDSHGEVVWKIGADVPEYGSQIDLDHTRISLVASSWKGARLAGRDVDGDEQRWFHASLCHDGTVVRIQPLPHKQPRGEARLCASGLCYLLRVADPRDLRGVERELVLGDAARISMLVVDDGTTSHEFFLDQPECRSLFGVVDRAVILGCKDSVQLRALDGTLLDEVPGGIDGLAWTFDDNAVVLDLDQDRSIRRWRIVTRASAPPAGSAGHPLPLPSPSSVPAAVCPTGE